MKNDKTIPEEVVEATIEKPIEAGLDILSDFIDSVLGESKSTDRDDEKDSVTRDGQIRDVRTLWSGQSLSPVE